MVIAKYFYEPWAISVFYHKTGKSATVLIYNIDTDEEETVSARYGKEFC